MLSIDRFILSVITLLLLTGCGVSSFKAQNWQPNDLNDFSTELYRSKNLEICRHQAQLANSRAGDEENQESASTDKYANFNKNLLKSCMEAKGYKLRELTDFEIFIDTLTAPFELPLIITGKNIEDTY